jgi:rfaE bifunctional protein nucleotidyltransferase chain/domain
MTPRKIINITDLSNLRATMETPMRVVLCHGVFDLLHVGHLKYFQRAKSHGDLLVVSVSADRYAKKGPGRPVVRENERLNFIAALEMVDFVVLSKTPTAVEVITELKPDVYFKGKDYRQSSNDTTGRLDEEKQAIESVGGRLAFSDTDLMSSTRIANQHFLDHIPSLDQSLVDVIAKISRDQTHLKVSDFCKNKLVLVGEFIDDVYRFVAPMQRASKENLVVNNLIRETSYNGGVSPIIKMFNDIGLEMLCVNPIASAENTLAQAVERRAIVKKIRYVDQNFNRKLFEIYSYKHDLDAGEKSDIAGGISKAVDAYSDVNVVVADFGHGLINHHEAKQIAKKTPNLFLNVQTNGGNRGFNLFTKYPKAKLLCIDRDEASLGVQEKDLSEEQLIDAVAKLIQAEVIIITLGKNGAIGRKGNKTLKLKSLPSSVVDTMGAGDAFFSYACVAYMSSNDLEFSMLSGLVAGALNTEILGHSDFVCLDDYKKYLKGLLSMAISHQNFPRI